MIKQKKVGWMILRNSMVAHRDKLNQLDVRNLESMAGGEMGEKTSLSSYNYNLYAFWILELNKDLTEIIRISLCLFLLLHI